MSTQSPGPKPLVRAEDAGVPSQRRGMKGTARDMILSMAVILAIVVGFVALVARPNEVEQPPVDLASAVQGATTDLGFEPSHPVGLPEGWVATNARVQRGTDGIRTWHLTLRTPDDRYAAVHQAVGTTDAWLGRQINDGPETATREISGRTWSVRNREDRGVSNLVNTDGQLTTVVTGTTSPAELDTLIAALTFPEPTPGS